MKHGSRVPSAIILCIISYAVIDIYKRQAFMIHVSKLDGINLALKAFLLCCWRVGLWNCGECDFVERVATLTRALF